MTTLGKMPSSNTRDRGERTVRAVLPPTARIKATPTKQNVDFFVNGQPVEVKWIGSGHLGDIYVAMRKYPKGQVIFVARHMSPGARAALSEAGVSWADETGAAEISIGTILVSRSGTLAKKPHNIKQWTPAVIAVAEAFLCGAKGTQSAMQKATGLSAGSCAGALRFLTDEKLLTSAAKRGPTSSRQISDPRRLLDAYASAVNARPSGFKIQIGVTWQDVLNGMTDLGRQLDSSKVDWAITGGAAAAVLAPFMTSVSQATVYVEAKSVAELKALTDLMKLRPIEGGRLTFKPFPSGAVQQLTTRQHGDLRVAAWPRVYADLLKEGVRGEEAAQHLYEAVYGRRLT